MVLMVDLFKKQTQIDLTKRMHGDIPQLHGIASHSKITDVHWTTINNRETGEEPVAVISFDNGSVVCFD